MKKTFKSILLISIFLGIIGFTSGCSSPTNTSSSSSNSDNTQSQPEQQPEVFRRKDCSITIPSTQTAAPNLTIYINVVQRNNCLETDVYKVNIKNNQSNLQLSRAEYSYSENRIKLLCENPGTISISLYNKTANVESNVCVVSFGNQPESGNNDENNDNQNNSGSHQEQNTIRPNTNYTLIYQGQGNNQSGTQIKGFQFLQWVSSMNLIEGTDYTVDNTNNTITITQSGITKIQQYQNGQGNDESDSDNQGENTNNDNEENNNNNGGQPQTPAAAVFVGTWTTTYTNALINTIEFYSNGTGKCYKSGYTGYNTFTWHIQNSTTLNIVNTTMNTNSSSTCTYSLSGNTLILTNFMGIPQNTPITFTKL